jgi:hypothetical protein
VTEKKLSRKQKKLLKKKTSIFWAISKSGKVYPIGSPFDFTITYKTPLKTLKKWARIAASNFDSKWIDLTVVRDIEISTIFLGMNHNFLSNGPPLLFETMIFGGEFDSCQWRYATIKQARRGHRRCVRMVKESINGK